MARFGQVLTAMVTPFAADGTLDFDEAQRLARWLLDHGNDGLVIAGTTGESATLTHDEQIHLIEAVSEAVDAPVVAGAGSNDTAAAVELTQRATEAGATAILTVAPYYNKPSQTGMLTHFRAVAEATDLPVMLYDVPHRTGRPMAAETTVTLAHQVPNVVALKDAGGDPAATARVVAETPDDFEVYSGDDPLTLPLLAVGAVGTIGVATHWVGAETKAMFEAWNQGNTAEAAALNARMLASYRFVSSDDAPNPVPAKAVMRALGLAVGHCRPPMGPDTEGLDDAAKVMLADLGHAVG